MKLGTALPLAAATFCFSLLVLALSADWRLFGDQTGFQPAQPIAFSHALHAGENKIDCQFCHTGADTGKHAAIPNASTCMKCHDQVKKDAPEINKVRDALAAGKPIAWVRVHDMAAFVRFDHSRHVNSGVACQSCHGPVQAMERVSQSFRLSMGDCLDCHRGKKIGLDGPPPAGIAVKKGPTDCVSCHY
jgi:hypothetical protein